MEKSWDMEKIVNEDEDNAGQCTNRRCVLLNLAVLFSKREHVGLRRGIKLFASIYEYWVSKEWEE